MRDELRGLRNRLLAAAHDNDDKVIADTLHKLTPTELEVLASDLRLLEVMVRDYLVFRVKLIVRTGKEENHDAELAS